MSCKFTKNILTSFYELNELLCSVAMIKHEVTSHEVTSYLSCCKTT